MKKKGIMVIIGLALLFVVMQMLIIVGNLPTKTSNKNLTIVTAPEQKEAMENEQFTIAEFEMPKIKGKNVALKKTAVDNGYNDVYEAPLALDGLTANASYWEGSSEQKEQIFTVDLEGKYNIHTMVLALNPDPIWGKRTQTFSISVSNDGENYIELLPTSNYDFDPNTGNLVVIDNFKETKAQYVQLTFTGNTGATAGQIAELEVYSND